MIDCKISKLPVKLSDICHHYNIAIIKNSNINENSNAKLTFTERGKSIFSDKQRYIIVKDTEPYPAQRFTIAHEIGHIIIPTFDEYEADRFSIGILAPACVLWGCNIHQINDIMKMCCISERAATIRSRRLELLYQRNKFLSSPLEQQVFEQFSDFIKNNRHSE